jgi:hypothetical protein
MVCPLILVPKMGGTPCKKKIVNDDDDGDLLKTYKNHHLRTGKTNTSPHIHFYIYSTFPTKLVLLLLFLYNIY